MYSKIALIVIWYFVAAFTPGFAATDQSTPTYTLEVTGITKGLKNSTVTAKDQDNPFAISDPKFAGLVELIQPGDRIDVVLDSDDPLKINELKKISKPCSGLTRLIALVVSFLIISAFFFVVTKGAPKKFIIGADNRYSNSKIQVVLWFSVLMTVYLAAMGLRACLLGFDYFGGIGITQNLLALSGISTLTYGAAKAVTVQKVDAAEQAAAATATDAAVTVTVTTAASTTTTTSAGVTTAEIKKSPENTENIFRDLFQNDHGSFDLGDTQMFFFILLAVATFLMTSFHFLGWLEYTQQITLPDVDTTLLSSLGLSQGAYLAKKAASDVGHG